MKSRRNRVHYWSSENTFFLKKNELNINRDTREFLEFRINNKIEGNESYHSERFKSQLINKVEVFKYLWSVTQDDGGECSM